MSENKLEKFFAPRSVAVIGASGNREKIGYGIMRNLIDAGFKGKVYPVNNRSKKILGLQAYASVGEIKGNVDLAVIVIPAQFVNDVIRECGEKGVKNVIVISAGFKEIGAAGLRLEKEMCDIAAKYDMEIIGPNCLGLADSFSGLNASFANGMISKGNLGFISQSGAICSSILDWAGTNKVGFSSFVSIGNKAVVSEAELMDYFRGDPKTTAVLAYLESIKNGKAFMKAAAELARVKPLIIIKPGVSAASQKAMQSHTGAMAGTDAAIRVAFSQTGAVRVKDMEELFNVSNFFSRYTGLKNNRIAIITNAGGPGVIGTDEIEENGLQLAKLSKTTQDFLKTKLPAEANVHNPVDVLGDAKEDRFKLALETLIEDKNVDGIVFILTPQRGTPVEKTAKMLLDVSKKTTKPIVVSFIGGKLLEEEVRRLKKSPLPTYEHLSGAIFALGKAWECEKGKLQAKIFLDLNREKESADKSIEEPETLTKNPDFMESLKMLEAFGIPIVKSEVAYTDAEAVRIAKALGYPVAMKIFSDDISHKTEVEGVKVNINSDADVREYYNKIKKKLGSELKGMIVQPMVKGQEIILGVKNDDSFGPMLMFGLGGIFAEVMKDVAFRFAPIDKEEALRMIGEIKSYKILAGYRNLPVMDIGALADALVGLSDLAMSHPEIKELDINPLFVQKEGEGCKAVDVRILI